MTAAATHWRIGPDRVLDLTAPQVMGILNVTPDSFSDGGRYQVLDAAMRHVDAMVAAGACIIDVGGESTRPGAPRIEVAEQIERVMPVVHAIVAQHEVPVSIDTTRAAVAQAALEAGASIINDVAAGQEDSDMLSLAARHECGLVLMHRRHAPDTDTWSHEWVSPPAYDGDVVTSVHDWLMARVQAATEAGVADDAICIDPGLGFGKDVPQNWELIVRSEILVGTGLPVLAASSRKSFIGAVTGQATPAERLSGSLAVTAVQAAAGIRLFRVHDVAEHCQALQQWQNS